MEQPLADRIRPKNLDAFVGQNHLVGKGKPLRLVIEQKKPFSMVFWGPPGVGKTTLAQIIAEKLDMSLLNYLLYLLGKQILRK